MHWWVLFILGIASVVLIIAERMGMRATMQLSFRGDIRREAAFLAQYAQSVCTPLICILVWQLDPRGYKAALAVLAAVGATAVIGMFLKRSFGRVRPLRGGGYASIASRTTRVSRGVDILRNAAR